MALLESHDFFLTEMPTSIVTPKTLSDLVKVVAKHGKRAMLVSGVDPASDRIPSGRVVVSSTTWTFRPR